MLSITRRIGESIHIGHHLKITVASITPNTITLHIRSGIGRYEMDLPVPCGPRIRLLAGISLFAKYRGGTQVQLSIDAPEYEVMRAELTKEGENVAE